MGNWFSKHAQQSRFLKDMPLDKDMTGSGGPHSKGHGGGPGHKHDSKKQPTTTHSTPKSGSIGGVNVSMNDSYGGSNSGNYDLLNLPGDIATSAKKAYNSITGKKSEQKKK